MTDSILNYSLGPHPARPPGTFLKGALGAAIIGWDVGGANVKAARIGGDGPSEALVLERPFPLWREPLKLSTVLSDVAATLGSAPTMAVTMTAELADCFATKREGVGFVLEAFRTAFPAVEPWVYGVDGRFRSVAAARQRPLRAAAANWMASATLVARTFPDAMFIDAGSTTTDIIPIVGGRVVVRGRTDTARLRSGELVYSGALRTPVCAMARWVPVRGRQCRVAAEHFAIAADVHLWLGRIEPRDYTCDTPDGRGRSRLEAAARLARMVCADLEMIGPGDVTAIAEHLARVQVRQVAASIRRVMRRLGAACPRTAVLAGQGTFLARAAAEDTGLMARDLSTDMGAEVARAAPSFAVAFLLAEFLQGRQLNKSGAGGAEAPSAVCRDGVAEAGAPSAVCRDGVAEADPGSPGVGPQAVNNESGARGADLRSLGGAQAVMKEVM